MVPRTGFSGPTFLDHVHPQAHNSHPSHPWIPEHGVSWTLSHYSTALGSPHAESEATSLPTAFKVDSKGQMLLGRCHEDRQFMTASHLIISILLWTVVEQMSIMSHQLYCHYCARWWWFQSCFLPLESYCDL